MDMRKLRGELEAVKARLHVMEIRVTLAQLWIGFYTRAYDTLLHYNINFRDLKEYKDDSTLEMAADLPLTEARGAITEWVGRLHTSLDAEKRRKGFKLV